VSSVREAVEIKPHTGSMLVRRGFRAQEHRGRRLRPFSPVTTAMPVGVRMTVRMRIAVTNDNPAGWSVYHGRVIH
jgi:hypothetical protein